MKPALILRSSPGYYVAYNEDGRRISGGNLYLTLIKVLESFDYTTVPLNSRLGRTILDKLEQKGKI